MLALDMVIPAAAVLVNQANQPSCSAKRQHLNHPFELATASLADVAERRVDLPSTLISLTPNALGYDQPILTVVRSGKAT